jgi:hypothetical protein
VAPAFFAAGTVAELCADASSVDVVSMAAPVTNE